MIIELTTEDTPELAMLHADTIEFQIYLYFIEKFGPPKELLIARPKTWGVPPHSDDSTITGWKGLEILEDSKDRLASESEKQVLNSVQNKLQERGELNPWLKGRVPKVTMTNVKRSGSFNHSMDVVATQKILNVAERSARQWQQDGNDRKGDAHCFENMKAALAKYEEKAV